MRESKKLYDQARVRSDHAAEGVSAGHDEGFNKVEPNQESPNEPAKAEEPAAETEATPGK